MGFRTATLNLDSLTADPAGVVDGEIWYRSDLKQICKRINGVTVGIGQQNEVVYQEGGVQQGNIYTSFADALAAAQLVGGQKIIRFDDSLGVPVIPAATYDLDKITLAGNPAGPAALITITLNAAIFENFRKVIDNLSLKNVGAIPIYTPTAINEGLELHNGCTLSCSGTGTFVKVEAAGTGFLTYLYSRSAISNAGKEVIEVISPAIIVIQGFSGSRLTADTIIGDGFALTMRENLSASIDWRSQALFTGTTIPIDNTNVAVAGRLAAFAGGGQANATLTVDGLNVFIAVHSNNDSAQLKIGVITPHTIGSTVLIKNLGANIMDVYPALGESIDSLANNIPVQIAAGASGEFQKDGNSSWVQII